MSETRETYSINGHEPEIPCFNNRVGTQQRTANQAQRKARL